MKVLLYFFLLTGTALARDDHTSAWTGVRKQKGIGACHAFATTALVEALYSEIHGRNIDLSEADVFARSFFGKDQKAAINGLSSRLSSSIGLGAEYLDENQGGYVDDDFELIKKSGIQLEEESPYKSLLRFLDSIRDSVVDRRKELDRTSYLRDNRPFILETVSSHRSQLESFYQSTPTSEAVADLLSGYRVHRIDLPGGSEEKIRILKSHLSCRPLAISVHSRALRSTATGMHAVVLRGYAEKKFLIRNSWSGEGESSANMQKLAPYIERAFVLTEKDRRFPRRDCP